MLYKMRVIINGDTIDDTTFSADDDYAIESMMDTYDVDESKVKIVSKRMTQWSDVIDDWGYVDDEAVIDFVCGKWPHEWPTETGNPSATAKSICKNHGYLL